MARRRAWEHGGAAQRLAELDATRPLYSTVRGECVVLGSEIARLDLEHTINLQRLSFRRGRDSRLARHTGYSLLLLVGLL